MSDDYMLKRIALLVAEGRCVSCREPVKEINVRTGKRYRLCKRHRARFNRNRARYYANTKARGCARCGRRHGTGVNKFTGKPYVDCGACRRKKGEEWRERMERRKAKTS